MCEYKLAVILSAVSGLNFWSHVTPKSTIIQCLMVWFCCFVDRVVLTERDCTKHVTASKLCKNKLVIKKKLYGPSFMDGIQLLSHSRLEPFQGGSLLFTTKFPEIPGTHFIDLGRMKIWVDLVELVFMSASYNFKHKLTPSRKASILK